MKLLCCLMMFVATGSVAYGYSSSGNYGRENNLFQGSSAMSGGSYSSGGGSSFGGNSASLGGAYGKSSAAAGQNHKGPIEAAVESHRSVEIKPVQMMSEPHEPQVIEVPSDDMPVTVHFKSQSSRVVVKQTHTPAQITEPEHTSSEDEPQRVIHDSVVPVIQEFRQIIQPYRRVLQQIQPVIEQTHTVIAKGEPRNQSKQSGGGAVVDAIGENAGLGGNDGAGSNFGKAVGGFSGAAKSYGNVGGGAGANYAAAASSVQFNTHTPTTTQQETIDTFFQQQQQRQQQIVANPHPLQVTSSNTNHNNNEHVIKSSRIASGHKNKASKMFSPSSSVYSSRRGDFGTEAAASTAVNIKPSTTRITLRPAPSGFTPLYKRTQVNLEGYQPQMQMQRLPLPMPVMTEQDNYFDMVGGDEHIAPFITFIAQPTRFRARARA